MSVIQNLNKHVYNIQYAFLWEKKELASTQEDSVERRTAFNAHVYKIN